MIRISDGVPQYYTDEEAVSAVAIADDYVKNTGDTMTGDLLLQPGADEARKITIREDLEDVIVSEILLEKCSALFKGSAPRFRFRMTGDNSGVGLYFYQNTTSLIGKMSVLGVNAPTNSGAFQFTNALNNAGYVVFRTKTGGAYYVRLKIHNDGKIDFFSGILKDIKNHVHSALSGTKKLIELDIGGVPYYFEVYPTKA